MKVKKLPIAQRIGDIDHVSIAMPTKHKPMYISVSELRDFLRCRLRWYWRHVVKVVPKQRAVPLAMGTLIHDARERWYGVDKKFRNREAMAKLLKQTFKEQAADYNAIDTTDRRLVEAMLLGYADWAPAQDRAIGLGNRREAEKWFELPLTSSGLVILRGKIDLAFTPFNMKRTMAMDECKSASQFRDNLIDLNLQISGYLWALLQIVPGMDAYIGYRTTMRKQMPTARVTQDLFRRETVERTQPELLLWARDTERAALDRASARIYPHATNECSWDCDYQTPCLLRGDADDFSSVIDHGFMPKPPREEKK